MLSPEVFNFPAPESLFQIEKFQGEVPLNNKNINTFHYNHLVTAYIPDSEENFDVFENFAEDSVYYKVQELGLEDLVDVRFISSFIRSGKLTLLSIDKRIDCDNCIGCTPSGQLHLNLTEDYYSLGIEGTKSHFENNRYVVTIDLADDKLLHNKAKLNKLKARLKNLEEKFSVLVSWHPPTEDVCPSSVAKYFVDLGYKVVCCTPAFKRSVVNCEIPEIDLADIDLKGAAEFAEWLGMVSLGGDLHTEPGDYLSSYVPPSVGEKKGPVTCLQWRGFFAATDVSGLIQQIGISYKLSEESWISVYVQGFDDCPVAWGSEEHHCFTNADNAYLMIFNKARGVICTQKCSRKKYK